MKKYVQRLKNERGMTLVELLAVIVILAIIATIAFVMIGKVIENSKQDAHIANAQQLIASAKLYEASNEEIGSSGVTDSDLNKEGLLDKFISPWGDTPYTGTVKKDGTDYTVTISNDKDCEITDVPEEEIYGDRDEVCGWTE